MGSKQLSHSGSTQQLDTVDDEPWQIMHLSNPSADPPADPSADPPADPLADPPADPLADPFDIILRFVK